MTATLASIAVMYITICGLAGIAAAILTNIIKR